MPNLNYEKTKEFKPDNNETGDVVIITDGRAGEYAFVGLLQAQSNSTKNGACDFGDSHKITTPTQAECSELDQVLGWLRHEYDVEPPEPNPSHYVFTHVT